ncbi:outer membrane protein [Sphingomonas sp.]|uniref:outer membrane protein n=1 Tax=Sphingomonas sp. TaxID=28214 RepID=UPI0025E31025|nr:outer membrane beta-barrel protein [Sphingomonas sp.]
MRKSFTVSVALIGVALAATPALAQTDGPAAFDGLYVGGSFGGAAQPNDIGSSILFDRDRNGSFGDTVITAPTATPPGANAFSPGFCNGRATSSSPTTGCRNDKDGIEYAARIGFDKQFNHMVFGVVGEFGKAEINDSVSAFSTTPAFYTMTRSLRYNAAVRARVGYVAGDSTLFYATGGGAYGRVRNSFTTSNGSNAFTTNGSKNAYGYSAGGGVEQKLGEHFSIGLEYIYTDLKDNKARVGVNPGTAGATNPFLLAGAGGTDFRRSDERFRWHSARVTAAFRF